MTDAPILFQCLDDGGMVPASPFWAKKAQEAFKPGEKYTLIEHEERSSKSHAHYFASLHEGFTNLPDELLRDYKSEKQLRKKLLIKAGFCQVTDVVCASKAEALRMAMVAEKLDPYSITEPKLNVCRIYTAESQSMRSMGKERFQASKDRVLDLLAELLGTSVKALAKADAA